MDVPAHKIASACLTDDVLLKAVQVTAKPVLLSTGMSTIE
jgi:sialic acid synthase SpsE